MSKDGKIFNISSDYCLRSIFSYLNYRHALNLVKYNKKLQHKLNLSKKNYTLNYQILNYKPPLVEISDKKINITYCFISLVLIISSAFNIIYFFTFSNYEETEVGKSFGLLNDIFIVNHIYNFVLSMIFCTIFGIERICIKCVKCLLFFNTLSIIFYLAQIYLIIVQLTIMHKIKKKLWNIMGAYIQVAIFIFIIVCFVYIFLSILKHFLKRKNYIFLHKFKGIDISNFELPNEFEFFDEKNKSQFLLSKIKDFKLYEKNYEELIYIINSFRRRNNLLELINERNIPDIFINENSEVEFLSHKKIYKLKKNKYLFKYTIEEFKKGIEGKDENILKILSIDILKSIYFITKNNTEYILIEDSNLEHNFNSDRIVHIYNYPRESIEIFDLE